MAKHKNGKFIITTYKKGQATYIVACLFCDGVLEYIKVLEDTDSFLIGSIVTAKVKQVVPSIPAAFVALDTHTMAFLPTVRFDNPVLTNSCFSGKLRSGDEILVQVTKAAVKTKDAVVSHEISISGKYCVVKTGSGIVNFSKQLTGKERSELLQILQKRAVCTKEKTLIGSSLDEVSVTIRTKAKEVLHDTELVNDVTKTLEQYLELIRKAKMRTCYTVHHKPVQDLRELIKEATRCGFEVEEIVTDLVGAMEQLPEARFYQDPSISLSMLYGLTSKLDTLLGKVVWLDCGGNLVIEHTEAMTVIDVNASKASGTKRADDLIELVNKEAAIEIVRQLRLRNISGMILVDFINFSKEQKAILEKEIIALVEEESSGDYAKVTCYGFTKLGLLEITRDKVYKPLHEMIK